MNTLTTIDELAFAPPVQHEVLEDTTSDHALLEATRTGDEDAFAELVSRYRNQITSYIYRMTSDYDNAVDLAQETFVRVYRARDRYQRSYAFSTYIYRIATNLAISELRKRKRRKLVSLTGFSAERRLRAEGIESAGWPPIAGFGTGGRRTPQRSPTRDRHTAGEIPGALNPARRRWPKLRRDRAHPGNERGHG